MCQTPIRDAEHGRTNGKFHHADVYGGSLADDAALVFHDDTGGNFSHGDQIVVGLATDREKILNVEGEPNGDQVRVTLGQLPFTLTFHDSKRAVATIDEVHKDELRAQGI